MRDRRDVRANDVPKQLVSGGPAWTYRYSILYVLDILSINTHSKLAGVSTNPIIP